MSDARIVLTGATGQVGWELQRALGPLGEVVAAGREQLDLADPQGLRKRLHELQPAVIVNAAAYTAVDRAESETKLAEVVNAAAPAVLAEEAAACGAWLVHYSTDYVFKQCKKGTDLFSGFIFRPCRLGAPSEWPRSASTPSWAGPETRAAMRWARRSSDS